VSFDERTILTTMLDYARDTVRAKCAGLTDADARRVFLPGSPLTTISGLVSHLRWVEYSWLEVILPGGEDAGRGPMRILTARCPSPCRSRLACIGCGCLSLRLCQLVNPGDVLAQDGPGARNL
jgi:hypothetical protein